MDDPQFPVKPGSDNKEGNQEFFRPNADQRKRLFSVLLGIGLAALLIGFFAIANSITSPFVRPTTNSTVLAEQQALDTLKDQDTDNDGIFDYDELFTHGTSPFVKDSDSDGKTDKEELDAKTDPNCPAGKTCGIAVLSNTNAAESNVNAAALRTALQKSGAPSYLLDQTDDATLLQAYRDTILGDSNSNSSISAEDLGALNASQVRSLLKSNGVDEQSLSAIDDATLMAIYRDALEVQP